MTIRSQLILLAIGAALPVLAFAILLSIVLVEQDRMTVQRGATDQARAMMSAVDAGLRGAITTIEAITASPALQGDDLPAFRAEALRVLATQPTVRLPATVSLLPIVPSTPVAHAASARSILIVEDNADARDMLREVLATQGHDVCEAADGAEGIVVAAQVMPEVAIIDIGLPDVDGYEVARRIRSQSSRPIALIAPTGYGQPADQRRALAAGFDLHLVKPITVERLDQAIATFGASPATLIAAG